MALAPELSSIARFDRIYIEISNICNLQCSFCPVVERDKKVMGLESFKKVLSQAAPLAEQVCLHLMGEPLAHPSFSEVLEIVEENLVKVQITTNGILLSRYEDLLLASLSLRQINFSLQSFSDNFPGRKIEDYLTKILNFAKRAELERPDLYINLRLWNLGAEQGENEIVISFLEEFYDVSISRAVDVTHIKSKNISGRTYLHFDSRFEWPSMDQPHIGDRGRCHGMSHHIGIHADGTVVPCCLDKEAIINLGNCLDQPLESLLKSPRAVAIKNGFASGQRVEKLCQHCSFSRRFSPKSEQGEKW